MTEQCCRDAYLLGVGRAIAYIEHTTALAQAAESEHTAKVIGEWSAKVVTAMRMTVAQSRPYCLRCGIPHTGTCNRPEGT